MIREKNFASSFLQKDKIPLIHRRISKYNSGQEFRIGTPESSDTRKIKVPKFSANKHRADLGRYGAMSVLQHRPLSGAQERKV